MAWPVIVSLVCLAVAGLVAVVELVFQNLPSETLRAANILAFVGVGFAMLAVAGVGLRTRAP